MKAMHGLERYVRTSGLEQSLIEMVKLRASQINGCAYCVDMHWKDARAIGETEQRLYSLSVWRETPFYTERERAAFAWTEALTLLPQNDVPDALYEHVRQHFDEKEIVDLTMTIILINGWNRFGVPFRDVPGIYQSKKTAQPIPQPG
jgi:AhpD family alkylhydroperoxidase